MRSGTLWFSGLKTTPPCLTGESLARHKSSRNGPGHRRVSPIVEFDGYVGQSLSRPLEAVPQRQNLETPFTL